MPVLVLVEDVLLVVDQVVVVELVVVVVTVGSVVVVTSLTSTKSWGFGSHASQCMSQSSSGCRFFSQTVK